MATAPAARKILVLTPQLPHPPDQGTKIRNYNLLANLSRRYEIHLMSFAEEAGAQAGPASLHKFCRSVRTVHVPARTLPQRLVSLFTSSLPDMAFRLWSAAFHELLDGVLATEQYDVIQVEGIEMARYLVHLRTVFPKGEGAPLLVFDDHNAEYVLQQRAFETDLRHVGRWPLAAYSLIQWRRLRRYERKVCSCADRVVAVSDADAAALRRLVGNVSVWVVPNGVDLDTYDPARQPAIDLGPCSLLFTGKMDFRPNVDGVSWFCERILPLIRGRVPGVTFHIAGKSPSARVRRLGSLPGVVVTGYVEDELMPSYFRGASVYVVPLRMGGGTRLKMLEAFAMRCAIVSTRLGAEGLGVTSGQEAVLADDPQAFATAVVELLHDSSARERMGQRGRALAERHYDWRRIVRGMDQVYEDPS